VHERHKGATKIPNSDPLFRIGRAIKTTSLVPRIHRSVGAINVGVTKGIYLIYRK
jgi:hypothetical protein